ncbi:MAG: phosphopentomutase [Pyrinomonadaceae bacterium]|nr:phosphopentomutase [Pyrinomonadaceae bacterium]
MNHDHAFDRVTLIVLDSLGIGAMPDAAEWGDAGANTLGHILESRHVHLPNLQRFGLGNILHSRGLPPAQEPHASFGRCALRSNGKDTTTGHWEIAGIILERAFPTYPNGFPPEIIERFVRETDVPGVLGNRAASGTEIIQELGAEHIRTNKPIVYTSADSVFQIAAHEDVIPIPKLYELCQTARRILCGRHEVGRVIARPFEGEVNRFRRTERRLDYAVPPPRENLLATLAENDLETICIGKVASVYDHQGVTQNLPAKNNEQVTDQILSALRHNTCGLIFANLVDFDMLYGHRRDVEGYARALEHFDLRLPEIEAALPSRELLIITADHGNDPTFHGTDHTREYTPLLVYGKQAQRGASLGTRSSLADIGQTVAHNFNLRLVAGQSFLKAVTSKQ